MTTNINTERIILDAYAADERHANLEVDSYGNAYGETNALIIGDHMFTMADAVDCGGEEGDGWGWSSGEFEDGEYTILADGWAETEERAREAITAWLAGIDA